MGTKITNNYKSYKSYKPFTRHDFVTMLERLIDEGILNVDSNVNYAGFDFKFDCVSYYIYTDDMITFDRRDRCFSAKVYAYDKSWWVHDVDGGYVNEDPNDAVRELTFYFMEDIENYIRKVYNEAHIAVEESKNEQLVKEIEEL